MDTATMHFGVETKTRKSQITMSQLQKPDTLENTFKSEIRQFLLAYFFSK
jgi:hypothetical protein